ncbi:MAG: M23 family metallopeptidase [Spirochaetales bacterium]|nr:M23 family metallopeptidase [Spirochaetales bacterium]
MKTETLFCLQWEGSERTHVFSLSPAFLLRLASVAMGAVLFAIFFFLLSPLESTTSINEDDPEDLLPRLQRTLHLSEILFQRQAQIASLLRDVYDEEALENNLATFGDARLEDVSPPGRLRLRMQLHDALITSNSDFGGSYQHFLGPVPRLKPLEHLSVNSPFGWRSGPFSRQTEFHGGLDFKSVNGTPVKATAAGRVRRAEYNRGGYGNLIVIEHLTGYQTYYAHLSSIDVTLGEYVYAGQRIGRTGQTGRVTGPHLHYEVRFAGRQKNPASYIPM